jgi:hypothetical protein
VQRVARHDPLIRIEQPFGGQPGPER